MSNDRPTLPELPGSPRAAAPTGGSGGGRQTRDHFPAILQLLIFLLLRHLRLRTAQLPPVLRAALRNPPHRHWIYARATPRAGESWAGESWAGESWPDEDEYDALAPPPRRLPIGALEIIIALAHRPPRRDPSRPAPATPPHRREARAPPRPAAKTCRDPPRRRTPILFRYRN